MKHRQQKHKGYWVIALIFSFSSIIGIVAYSKYVSSEKTLLQNFNKMSSLGKTASVETCVDHVLNWRKTCQAMKSLCDVSVPRMMGACLGSQNRKPYCNQLGTTSSDTHFGYKECQARKVNKKTKKACALSYRVIDNHCKTLERMASL